MVLEERVIRCLCSDLQGLHQDAHMFKIMNFSFESHNGLLFTLILHLATALSALIYFWNDVKKIILSICMLKRDENLHFSLMILISMIPAGFVGFFYERLPFG